MPSILLDACMDFCRTGIQQACMPLEAYSGALSWATLISNQAHAALQGRRCAARLDARVVRLERARDARDGPPGARPAHERI